MSPLLSESSNDLLTLLHLYNSELSSVLDEHAPLKSRMVTIRPAAPWFSEEIKLERRVRRRLERRWRGTRLPEDRQYSRAIWSILEVLSAIFCIFVQALFRKFEVIEEKCTKAYWLSVFLQTDQMWRLMWSSGFHFCLFSSPLNDLHFSVRF